MLKEKLIKEYSELVSKQSEKFKFKATEQINKIGKEAGIKSIPEIISHEELPALRFVTTIQLDGITFVVRNEYNNNLNVILSCPICKEKVEHNFHDVHTLKAILYEKSAMPHTCYKED